MLGLGLGIIQLRRGAFILDRFPGAAAAYSLRRLSKNTTNVVRVRRSSDNDEADFSPEKITNGALLDFTGTGASAAGYVPAWYDQSGNSNDATQATAASQPKIVDAGVLVTDGGKPALDFDGANAALIDMSIETPRPISNFVVARARSATGDDFIVSNAEGTTSYVIYINNSSSFSFVDRLGGADLFNAAAVDFIRHIFTVISKPGLTSTYAISGVFNEELSNSTSEKNLQGFYIGSETFDGLISESILYPSDQSANREAIEQNIADYYGITLA